MATTGEFLWVMPRSQLGCGHRLSGSGPAYVFYFMEAMTTAGTEMGLSREQAHQLAVATFVGASELARSADEPPRCCASASPPKAAPPLPRITVDGKQWHGAIFIAPCMPRSERAKTWATSSEPPEARYFSKAECCQQCRQTR
jgi:pyrroline-5-carboxylate reductase